MKALLILLGLGFIISFGSCSKGSTTPSYLMIADTGLYYVKTGTVTVVRPDSTYTYDASKDNVTIYHNSKNSPDQWDIFCYNVKNGSFQINAIGAPAIGNDILSYSYSYSMAAKLGYYYNSYSSTNAGTVTLNTYNSNGIAASGSFTSNVGKYSPTNSARIGTTSYIITGSFDLKLNPK